MMSCWEKQDNTSNKILLSIIKTKLIKLTWNNHNSHKQWEILNKNNNINETGTFSTSGREQTILN